MNEPIVEPILAVESEPAFKTNAPLIPRDSVAGRALVVVIAIMTFLACLTAGAALLVADASQAWRSDVLRDATIQVKPRPGDDVESLVAKAVAIAAQAPEVEFRPRSFQGRIGEASRAVARRGARPQSAAHPPADPRQAARPGLRRPRDAALRRSPQPFRKPISTTIGSGRRASAPWPTLSSFLRPLFSR